MEAGTARAVKFRLAGVSPHLNFKNKTAVQKIRNRHFKAADDLESFFLRGRLPARC